MAFRKIKAGLVNGDVEQFIGEVGNLFFDIDTGILRLSDGTTPGGGVVGGGSGGGSYTLPTATTTVKGGVKIDGTTIAINNQVISVGTIPYNKLSGAPTAVSAFTNDSGYITSSALSGYATQTYVTTRGYITSAGVPSAVSSFTNDSGYLTTSSFDLDTIDLDANNKLHATGILPGDVDGFTAIFAGRAAGIAALPNTVLQSQAQVNDYAQNNFQNTYDGNHASTEWVATSPNGDDSNYYIDMGITGASWDGTAANSLYTNVGQRDGYLYVQGGNASGGNLIVGTSLAGTYTKIIAGDASAGNTEVARFSSTEVKLKKQLTFNDNTTQTTAWTGSVSWDNVTSKPTILTTLNSLDDVTTVGATDGQVLKYNASLSIWQPAADLVGSGGSGIGLTDLSASNASASGGGSLSYNNTSGVFTFTPPDLSSYVTSSSLSSTLSTYATQTYVTSQGYITSSGNAATATKLGTARAINGVNFDGSAAITITAVNPNALTIGTGLSGTSYDGSTSVTIAVDNTIARRADTTYVGTTSIALNRSSASQTLTGVSIDGNAATVTNGVYTTGTYANPSWITSLAYSKLTDIPTLFSGAYSDLTGKPTVPVNISQLVNDTGYITASAIPASFTFNVAADDSTLRTISTEETIKFIGAGGITTSSDAEGNITITQGVSSSLANGSDTLSLDGASKVNLPGGTASIFAAANVITLTPDSSGNNYFEIANNVGVSLYTNRAFELRTNKGSTDRIWSFNQSGSLTFPDDTIQTTAYTTTAARGLFSAANNSASGSGGSLSYSNGVYTFTPALNIAGNAATVTNGVYTTDTGTVTNTMLAGSIANNKLANSSVTINGTSVSLGSSATITAAAGTLTGSTLASGVTASSLTSVGTLSSLTVSGGQNLSNGDDQTGTGSKTQLRFGFNGTTQYAHWIRSRHNANASTGNWIDFYTSDGTQSGTFPTNAVLGLSIGNGAITVPQVIVGSSGITTAQSTVPIVNTTATTVNFAGAATALNMGASTGTTTINNNLSMASGKTIGTTGSITANASTAFIAGDNAISNVALQMPSESALRNLTNGATNMYFDVSIGGSTHGQFQFRSSSSYTNVLTMSSTGVTFNTDATFTSRTPSVSRTAFNAAIDTEITVDSMRFRISNQGGIFPQVIGNGSSRNLAWTGVGAISGSAVTQVGSTGTIVSSSAWTTLYNSHGMDSAGDTVTVTLQDKAAGRIYRITFMRSDNGSTTGYNIIGERIL